MKKIKRTTLCLALGASLWLPSLAKADSVLDFMVRTGRQKAATPQAVAVKDGQVMIKAAGGDKNLDLYYRRAAERVVIVDHREHTVKNLDEQQVEGIKRQAKEVQPLLQSFAGQVAKLSPEQRQEWQAMLGGTISLETIASAAQPLPPSRLQPTGATKRVAGIPCRMMRVMQGETPLAEVCLAETAALKIPDSDSATLRALLGLYERLSSQGQGLARQFGLILPSFTTREVTGIPIEFRDLSRQDSSSATLLRIKTTPLPAESMTIPAAYTTKPLTIWPRS